MRKVFLSAVFFIFVFFMLKAAPQQSVVKQAIPASQAVQTVMASEQFKAKMNDLINQRRQVSMQIYQRRVQLIKEDPDLRILHKTILDLHAKMAKQLNANPKIVPLVDKGKEIDDEIKKLINDYQAAGGKK